MSRKLLVFLIVLSIAGCATRGPTDHERAQLHLQIGTSFLTQGNFPRALRELLTAEQLDNNNPVIENNLGLAYFVRSKYELAEKHTRRAIALQPDYTDARNNLGRILIERGLYDDAITVLTKAAQDLTYVTPEKIEANLGVAYFMKKNYQEAIRHLKKSLLTQKKNCRAMNFYGRSLLEIKKYQSAARALDEAIQFCEPIRFEEPRYYSGLSYYMLGDQQRARARLEEIVELHPDNPFADKAKRLLKTIQ